ncbi:LamG domain-containing protein [Thalassobacterium sedimentorum]|uniref:LamG domain-containing protein n=1 Tax=Thalassobacterium sedimentorum TaxID=3041258 RepID=UPI00281166AD|nr:LamG domain-containing protein [Coraliomargarita sp. SDUM461004]
MKILLQLSCMMVLLSPLIAETYYMSFDGVNGEFPADWLDRDSNDFTPALAEIRDGAFYMSRANTEESNLGIRRNAVYNGEQAWNWQDYTIETLWSESRQDARTHSTGLIARWQGMAAPEHGYYAYEENGQIIIGKGLPKDANVSAILASTQLSRSIHDHEVTRMTFSVQGNTLTAEIFAEVSEGEYTDSLGRVSVIDGSYNHGSAGVRCNFTYHSRSASFYSFAVDVSSSRLPMDSYDESFHGLDGTIPDAWSYVIENQNSPPVMEIRNNVLYAARENTPESNTGQRRCLVYQGENAALWQDYTVETFWSESRQDSSAHGTGLIARWQGYENEQGGYYAYESGGSIVIGKDLPAAIHSGSVLGSAVLSRSLADDEISRLVFTVNGQNLTAKLFAANTTTGEYSELLGSITVTDDSYVRGPPGIRAYFGYHGRHAEFRSFDVDVYHIDFGIRLHLPLEAASRTILDSELNAVGTHWPASILDQDNPETLDPTRYRVLGRYGNAIRYFADDRSYTRMDDLQLFETSTEELAVSVEVKIDSSEKNNFASLISNRSDSDTGGFALFLWGENFRFSFGDGQSRHDVWAPLDDLKDGYWHHVAVTFDRGIVTLCLDNVELFSEDTGVPAIASTSRNIFMAGYPLDTAGRDQYAFDGWLDEVCIGTQLDSLESYLERFNLNRDSYVPLAPDLDYTVQPIDGNEVFFGGEKVFHTFYGQPVPLTFLFKRNSDELIAGEPALVFYMPDEIELKLVHQSNHNEAAGGVSTSMTTVQTEERTWRRYQTTGIDLTDADGVGGWKQGPFISLALDALTSVDQAPIRYGLYYNGVEHDLTEATVKFLSPPPAVIPSEQGRFEAFGYFIMTAFAYPDENLWASTADLLYNIGLRGKGRFYSGSKGQVRVDFDSYLKKRGFTLYEIGLWGGPDQYDMASDPQTTTANYLSRKYGEVANLGQDEPVIFDFEPWSVPRKALEMDEMLANYADWMNLAAVPSKEEILASQERDWIDYWIHVSNDVYGAMAELVDTYHPDPDAPRVAYTYLFPYDDEEALYTRFWSIPKDPRLTEQYDLVDVHLLSLYHVNDRELFDQVQLSQTYLQNPIWGISAIARVSPAQDFATVENSLSPQRIEQKFVMTAALGMERQGIWPGRGWIDGAFLVSIGNASRFIWQYEQFYFDGIDASQQFNLTPNAELSHDAWAYTAHEYEGQQLVTVFNFTDHEITLNALEIDTQILQETTIEAHGYQSLLFGEPKSNTILDDFNEWIGQFDLSIDQQAPTANPSRDGINNMLKYAMNLNPVVPTLLSDRMQTSIFREAGTRYLEIVIRERIAMSFQTSTDLIGWTTVVPDQLTLVRTIIDHDLTGDGSTQLIRYRLKMNTDDQFVRLLIAD